MVVIPRSRKTDIDFVPNAQKKMHSYMLKKTIFDLCLTQVKSYLFLICNCIINSIFMNCVPASSLVYDASMHKTLELEFFC
jgi:hypothetical protein